MATFLWFAVSLIVSVAVGVEFLTGETGHRVGTNQNSQTATDDGAILLQDVYALEKLRRFNHERIPERVVHAPGSGVHGYFESTVGLSGLTAAKFLSRPGIKTELFVRFSTVTRSKGSPEAVRDPRGFSIKFKTATEGNFDLVGNNLPVFFIRDHIKFPDLVHSARADPVTNQPDPNRSFDFFSAIGGTATHMLTYLFSDLGIPKSFRFMDGNSVHAYKFVNANRKITYVKLRWTPRQGIRNLTMEEAAATIASDQGHATRDLYDAIGRKEFPVWDLKIQTMRPNQLNDFAFSALDATKEWPEAQFPFRKIGHIVLNRVPDNFHLFSEQSAFDPGNFLPGSIEPSEDRLLQGRLISYHESQTHRLGSNNFNKLPVNKPISPVRTYNQDGVMAVKHAWSGSVNYEPSNDPNAFREDRRFLYSTRRICGMYEQRSIRKTLNFRQAGELFVRFTKPQQDNLIKNFAAPLGQVRSMLVRNTICAHTFRANAVYGRRLSLAAGCNLRQVRRIARSLVE